MDTSYSYWQRQTADTPLFPDTEWNKPEQRTQAGRLGIVGGNKLSFVSIAGGYQEAITTGAGTVRVLLPDVLKKAIPPTMTEVVFAPTNQSGSLSKEASTELDALGSWAEGILLIGDAGRSSETAIVYENFVREYAGHLTVTRDAVDLLKNSASVLVERPDTLLVVSFAQLQKLFQAVYYPKILSFSMQLIQLVENLHKFTITYPTSIIVLHGDTIVIASNGEVVTQAWDEPMAIWRGSTATRAACYWLWNPERPLEAATASIAS